MTKYASHATTENKKQVSNLAVQLMAAEIHLTYFAARQGKHSEDYQKALNEFVEAWKRLRSERDTKEFHKDVALAS